MTSARVQDVRLTGNFKQKTGEIKELVGEVLADAFDNLEVGGE